MSLHRRFAALARTAGVLAALAAAAPVLAASGAPPAAGTAAPQAAAPAPKPPAAVSRPAAAGTSAGPVPAGLAVGDTIGGRKITRVVHLTATAYGPSRADNYPYPAVDFFGKPLVPGDVAVDPSVIPLGTLLYVRGYRSSALPPGGEYARARDEGGAIQGHRIDLFIDGGARQVSNFGVQPVTAYILN